MVVLFTEFFLSQFVLISFLILLIYVSFSDQKAEFTARKQEMDKGKEAIKELIDTLDRRKDEAIERTFKGVALQMPTTAARIAFRTLPSHRALITQPQSWGQLSGPLAGSLQRRRGAASQSHQQGA